MDFRLLGQSVLLSIGNSNFPPSSQRRVKDQFHRVEGAIDMRWRRLIQHRQWSDATVHGGFQMFADIGPHEELRGCSRIAHSAVVGLALPVPSTAVLRLSSFTPPENRRVEG